MGTVVLILDEVDDRAGETARTPHRSRGEVDHIAGGHRPGRAAVVLESA